MYSPQNDANLLIHAAEQGNLSIFEYLVERGATIPSGEEMNASIAVMLQHRRDWIDQAKALAHRWHIPLIAIRVIHEYVVGFNWPAVRDTFERVPKSVEVIALRLEAVPFASHGELLNVFHI